MELLLEKRLPAVAVRQWTLLVEEAVRLMLSVRQLDTVRKNCSRSLKVQTWDWDAVIQSHLPR